MKIIKASEAAQLIKPGWTVTTGGFGHCGAPEALLKAVEHRFQQQGQPSHLTLFFASGPGDRGERGLNRLAHAGLIRRIIGGFWSLAPRIGELAMGNEIEAHNWPQGVVSHMFRAIAGGKPGVVTEVGLGTFIDPAQEGGRISARTPQPLIDRVEVNGAPMLLYKSMPIQCALLRGTCADIAGNISMEHEANIQDVLAQAQAVRNCGGIVIVQVRRMATAGALALASVRIPGFLVDYVVVADEEDHWQTYGEKFNPAYCGLGRGTAAPAEVRDAEMRDRPLEPLTAQSTAKRVIARRCLLELMAHAGTRHRPRPLVVNLGIGTPETIAAEADLNGWSDTGLYTLTVESGATGGAPAGGLSFGATAFPDALLSQAELFDLYDGGGIDLAFLGFGQIDGQGRINVASLGGRLNGVGGFVNISQAAKRLVFCGMYTAGRLSVRVSAGEVEIVREGDIRKMVTRLERVCYDPGGRVACGSPLLVTERAVFRLSKDGLELIEVAPGIDVARDILAHADVPIRVHRDLGLMPASVFSTARLAHPITA